MTCKTMNKYNIKRTLITDCIFQTLLRDAQKTQTHVYGAEQPRFITKSQMMPLKTIRACATTLVRRYRWCCGRGIAGRLLYGMLYSRNPKHIYNNQITPYMCVRVRLRTCV